MKTFTEVRTQLEASQGMRTTLVEAVRCPDVRWERVAELRVKIARGQYRVSSDALAGRLMEVMRERGRAGAAFPG
jgi:anti-sigma28 factor (negative regulator of flagellin synthesis)